MTGTWVRWADKTVMGLVESGSYEVMSAWLNALIAELEPADRSQGRQHPQARQFASESHRFKTNSSITVCRGWNAVRVPPRAQHSPSSEGFCFNLCTKLWSRPSDAGARAVAWPPRWPIQVCEAAGSGPWLVGLPPALYWGYAFLSWLWRPGWPLACSWSLTVLMT